MACLSLAGAVVAQGEAPAITEVDTSAGQQAFEANCAACHQQSGQGVPGAFPPLAGNLPFLAQADGARDYLAHVLLFGLQGEITVDGQTYNGVMPAWQQLGDEQIADILNYALTAWGNAEQLPEGFAAFTAEEIAAQRDAGLTPAQVHEERQQLELPEE